MFKKIFFFLLLSFFLIGCSSASVPQREGDTPQQKRNSTFSTSTETGRMFNEILDVIQFGNTPKEEIGQKLCGRTYGIYPEDLTDRELLLVSQTTTSTGFYKVDCPAITDKWENIAPHINSVQIVFDEKDISNAVIYNTYWGSENATVTNIIKIFGDPELIYYHLDNDGFEMPFFAYPERGIEIEMFLLVSSHQMDKKLDIPSDSTAEEIIFFNPLSTNKYKKAFINAADIEVDDWQIVASKPSE